MKSVPELEVLAKNGETCPLRPGNVLPPGGLWLVLPFYMSTNTVGESEESRICKTSRGTGIWKSERMQKGQDAFLKLSTT